MVLKRQIKILLIFLFLAFFSCEKKVSLPEKVEIGQTKEEIKLILGEPNQIENIEKTTEIIWGPEELFWEEIDIGARLEVWEYQIQDSSLRLYFINDQNKLSYKMTVPQNVVYESKN
jgi:hypothetical protein